MAEYKKYICELCHHIYDEAEGDAEADIPAGTLWADIPMDWVCPICGASKRDFVLLE